MAKAVTPSGIFSFSAKELLTGAIILGGGYLLLKQNKSFQAATDPVGYAEDWLGKLINSIGMQGPITGDTGKVTIPNPVTYGQNIGNRIVNQVAYQYEQKQADWAYIQNWGSPGSAPLYSYDPNNPPRLF